jgi:predicted nuclease of predicted toxin-antitoxin system
MRVLIDECLPSQLRSWLARDYDTSTLRDMGWEGLKNGKLLRAANDEGFDVLVTADKNMHYQQNFEGLRISSVVIPSNYKPFVQKAVPALRQSIDNLQPGQKVIMDLGRDADVWESMRLHAIEYEAGHITHRFKRSGIER